MFLTYEIVILVILIFLQRGRVLSSKYALCVYYTLDKLLALEVVSDRVPLATQHSSYHCSQLPTIFYSHFSIGALNALNSPEVLCFEK